MPTLQDEVVTLGGRTYRLHATGQRTEDGWGYRLYDLGQDGRPLAFVWRAWVPGAVVDGIRQPRWGWRLDRRGAWYATSAALVAAVLAARDRSAA